MKALYNFYFRRFPDPGEVFAEMGKLSVLRIIIGILLLYRCGEIVYTANYIEEFRQVMIPVTAFLALLFLFTIGFMLPVTGLATIVCLSFFDMTFKSTTLGSAVCVQFLLVVWLANSGLRFSLDAWLMKKQGFLSGVTKKIYNLFGAHDRTSLKRIYMFGFLSYGVISLGAILFHIQDHYWISGETVQVFFTGSYMSKHYDFFRDLVASHPALYHHACIFLVFGQSVFQLFMIPLFTFRLGRIFVLVWSVSFFIASFTLIQLSYLPHVELLFWIALFYTPVGERWYQFRKKITDIEISLRPFRPGVLKAHLAVYVSFYLIYIAFRFPVVNDLTFKVLDRVNPTLRNKSEEFVTSATYRFGLDLPLVFNETDLMMNQRWFVLYRLTPEGREMIPANNFDGSRGYMIGSNILQLNNHGSDLLYFGTILRYRRKIIDQDIEKFHAPGAYGTKMLERLADFDKKHNHLPEGTRYSFEVMQNRCITGSLEDPTRFDTEVVYSDTLD